MAPTTTPRHQMALDMFTAPPSSRARETAKPSRAQGSGTAPAPAAPLRARLAATATATHMPPSAAPVSGPASLDDVLNGTWRALGARRAATCLVCGSTMRRAEGARGADCGSCGSSLS